MKKNILTFLFLFSIAAIPGRAAAQNNNTQSPDFDKEPKVIKTVEAVYPADMLSGGWEATVYVKVNIDATGNVIETKTEKIQVSMVKSAGQQGETSAQSVDGKAFAESASKAVKQWKFSPAQMQGKPVAVWITVPFRFKLSGKDLKPGQEASRAQMDKDAEPIKDLIENILQGKDIASAKKSIKEGAHLIYKGAIENLYAVLNGERKNVHLVEGKESSCTWMNMNITDDGKSALVVWRSSLPKEKTKRMHTITLSRGDDNTWKITHWHVSW